MATLKITTLKSNNFALRQQTITFLLNVVGNEHVSQLRNEALDGLLEFAESDFTAEIKAELAEIDII